MGVFFKPWLLARILATVANCCHPYFAGAYKFTGPSQFEERSATAHVPVMLPQRCDFPLGHMVATLFLCCAQRRGVFADRTFYFQG